MRPHRPCALERLRKYKQVSVGVVWTSQHVSRTRAREQQACVWMRTSGSSACPLGLVYHRLLQLARKGIIARWRFEAGASPRWGGSFEVRTTTACPTVRHRDSQASSYHNRQRSCTANDLQECSESIVSASYSPARRYAFKAASKMMRDGREQAGAWASCRGSALYSDRD